MSTTHTTTATTTVTTAQKRPCRVILLLDLDCFYAQCERVRLGLSLDTSLALLQWNSVLAVTYPAREQYSIKRGDSWEAVRQKSHNQCLALHLPLLTKTASSSSSSAAASSNTTATPPPSSSSSATACLFQDESTKEAYERVYVDLSEKERQDILKKELNVRRYSHEGKACLERYRIASARIFQVILETLQERLGQHNFILERASIDELFMDVTEYCWKQCEKDEASQSNPDDADVLCEAMRKTVLVENDDSASSSTDNPLSTASLLTDTNTDDPSILRALAYGCHVAYVLRQAAFTTLGFTLSAGIATSKLVSKLGASYGKPNGQALIRPSCIPHVMECTPISSVRNLGGKIGKRVQELLAKQQQQDNDSSSSSQHTMGDIAKYLSLPVLCEHLGHETGRVVFDACRGIDEEPVKPTINALVKSITAFKSLQQRLSVTSGEMREWLLLLAREVVSRVVLDSHRNQRYPKNCTIQYGLADRSQQTSKSLRIPFPSVEGKSEEETVNKLVEKAKEVIVAKEGQQVQLNRVGFCATDFQPRLRNGGISSYFAAAKGGDDDNDDDAADKATAKGSSEQDGDGSDVAKSRAEEEVPVEASSAAKTTNEEVDDDVDKDLELARKLQASYDRENEILTASDEKRARRQQNRQAPNSTPTAKKRARIDTFFAKKK